MLDRSPRNGATILLRDGRVYVADHADRESGAIVAEARRRWASGPQGSQTYEFGDVRMYLWPLREVRSVVWEIGGERDGS